MAYRLVVNRYGRVICNYYPQLSWLGTPDAIADRGVFKGMGLRDGRTAWNRLSATEWRERMERQLMEPTKRAPDIDHKEFKKSLGSEVRSHKVKLFYDPTPESKKREVAENFREYLKQHRDPSKTSEK